MFSIDNRFFRTVDRLADLFWLNLLWLICCIPIVTIGASTTAMYYITLKMVRDEESYIARSFFKSFKENFIQATIIWIVTLFFAAVLYVDIYVFAQRDGIVFKGLAILIYATGIVLALILTYVFPMLAKFDNTTLNIIKNSLLVAVLNAPRTALLLFMILIPYGIIAVIPYLIIAMILFGGSGTAYATSHIYVQIFDKLVSPEDDSGSQIDG